MPNEKALQADVADALESLGWRVHREVTFRMPARRSKTKNEIGIIDIMARPPAWWRYRLALPVIGIECKDDGGMSERVECALDCFSAMEGIEFTKDGRPVMRPAIVLACFRPSFNGEARGTDWSLYDRSLWVRGCAVLHGPRLQFQSNFRSVAIGGAQVYLDAREDADAHA